MKTFVKELKEDYSFLQGGKLEGWLMENPNDLSTWRRPALIVVPGGGYHHCSRREGETVAAEFMARGFQTFIFNYLCAPDNARYPEQLFELSSAVDYVRKHAEEFKVNPDEIFLVGFSAGGHLTGNLAVEHQNISKKAGVELDCKPTAIGLGYPVISQIHGHQGSYDTILKGYSEEEKAELYKVVNLDQAVNEQTPPAFIWATAQDGVVPTDNALRYAMAMDKARRTYELHIYPHGPHGLSSAGWEINSAEVPDLYRIRRWIKNCAEFFYNYVSEPVAKL